MQKKYLEAGEIVSTHGVQGEVKILPWADGPEFLLQFDTFYLDGRPYAVRSARVHKTCVLASLEGIDTPEQGMALRGKRVCIDRDEAKLPEGSVFIADLIGCRALDEDGAELGRIEDVLTMPSSDVYVIAGEKRYMVPAVREFVREIRVDEGYVRLHLIEGMRIDIMTLFPDTVGDVLSESILGRAQERGILRIETHQIRDYTANRQNQVDDYPYGGGHGAVLQADPLYRCWCHVCDEAGAPVHTIYLSPAGHVFDQSDARRLAKMDNLVFVCGHYEGIDQRFIDECVDEELSIGDFVVTGGEIPAMAITDAVCRLVPGVLSDAACFEDESHWAGTLEYPQYSRPAEWHGLRVPDILLSGDHAKVARWRRKQSILRTRERRPDLYAALRLDSKEDKKILREIADEDEDRAAAQMDHRE